MRRLRNPDLLALMHLEGGECCLTGAVDGLELHHIYPRAQGGDDCRANLVFLSHDAHWKITVNDTSMRLALGEHISRERPDFLNYLVGKLGPERAQDWLERRLLVASDRSVV